jgi:outer membrane protein OmpA-like peptidoglycan-associated protein
MNQSIKIFVLFLAALSINSVSFAQQKGKNSTKSVIVMSKAQLDSLLAGIAHRKKAQMAKREQVQSSNNPTLNSRISAKPAAQKPEMGQISHPEKAQKLGNPTQNDARIFRELDRMNKRMDRLMMEMHKTSPQSQPQSKNSNYPERSNTTIIPNAGGQSPPTFYQRERPGIPNRPRKSGNAVRRDSSQASNQDTLSMELKSLHNKIEALQTKIANRSIKSQKQQKIAKKANGNNSLLLKNYHQTIYFANNSTALNSADKTLLSQLAKMIKRNDKHVTVLVQGYASKIGSGLYNYKISLKRADAVKNVLTNDGISAGKIETLGHGVNMSHNAPAARRVEITLLID